MTTHYVGYKGVGAWLGVPPGTVSKWVSRYAETAPTPAPDADIEGRPGWLPERETDWRKWDTGRAGQGAPGRPKPGSGRRRLEGQE